MATEGEKAADGAMRAAEAAARGIFSEAGFRNPVVAIVVSWDGVAIGSRLTAPDPVLLHAIRQMAQALDPTSTELDFELALDAIDEAMGFDKMGEEDWIAWCNRWLALMKRHGHQTLTSGWS